MSIHIVSGLHYAYKRSGGFLYYILYFICKIVLKFFGGYCELLLTFV